MSRFEVSGTTNVGWVVMVTVGETGDSESESKS